MAKKVCYPWAVNWAKSMPDPIVKGAIDKGLIDPECLPSERRKALGLEEEAKEEIKSEEELEKELAK